MLSENMARRLRQQFPGAVYHLINRGNYRRDVFTAKGAARVFETTLGQAAGRFGWRVHAYVIMSNHYHLALETPEPNLAAGMHWLQGTFAVRFNRFRAVHGHLFQGRYQSLLVEDVAALSRVIDYIHLNPVRAKVLPPEKLLEYRWSSLPALVRSARPTWLTARGLHVARAMDDSRRAWDRYFGYLVTLAKDEAEQERLGHRLMAQGGAIGTAAWRKAVERENSRARVTQERTNRENLERNEQRWQDILEQEFRRKGVYSTNFQAERSDREWKLEVAARLRGETGAPYGWIARELQLGSPGALRVALHRRG